MLNQNHKFKTEKQDKTGSIKRFIGAFLAFALVFGSISAVVIIKHNDISLKSLLGGKETTAVSENTEKTDGEITQPISGSANFLLYCTDSSTGDFHFIAIVTADMDTKAFTVRPIQTDNPDYLTALETGGGADLAAEIEKTENIKINKYIASNTETFATAIFGRFL